jgi:TetR/AcrR family transcriptional repressor of nem operon
MSRPINFDEAQALDNAMRLFWQKGYCETTAQDIADHLGLNRSSIYNTFKDKRTLFLRTLQHYRQRESAGLLAFLAAQEPGPEAIGRLLEYVVQASITASGCPGCFMVNSAAEMGSRDPEVRDIVEENLREVVEAFTGFIRKAQQNGSIPPEKDAESLAIALFHSMTALRITTKIVRDPGFYRKNLVVTLQMFY